MPEQPRLDPVQRLYDCLRATRPDGSPDYATIVKAASRLTVIGERVAIPTRDREGVWHDGDEG